MVIGFALFAALLYGSADFLGGMASRQAKAASVVMLSAPASAVVMIAVALISGTPFQTAGLGWAVAGGAAGGIGLIVFYAGLAAGPMSVVAPVAALVSTLLPVGVALAAGERASTAVYAGAMLCLVAIGLVSMEQPRPGETSRRPGRGLGYGAVAGISFGMFFLFVRNAGEAGVLWPVCAARVAGTVTVLAAALWLGTSPPGRSAGWRVLTAAVGSGVLDSAANVSYLIAVRAGLFGMAVVITSLYPGITVLLARVVLGERMRGVQRAGLVLAAAGVALVTF
ncbi:MAG TPA: DMT family transporter [Streptosporangiaceae bacterium]